MSVNINKLENPGIAIIPKKLSSHNTKIRLASPLKGHGKACIIQRINPKIRISYKDIALPKKINKVISVSANAGICKYPSINSMTSKMSMRESIIYYNKEQ